MRGLGRGAKCKMFLINSVRLTTEKLALEGSLPVSSFERLNDSIVSKGNMVHYYVFGGSDRLSRPTISMVLKGAVDLLCQRCMKPMPFLIDIDTTLTLFESEDALGMAEEDDADLDGIVSEQTLNLLWLIEEELILTLPYIPAHDECVSIHPQLSDSEADNLHKLNPFSVLKHIKIRSEN